MSESDERAAAWSMYVSDLFEAYPDGELERRVGKSPFAVLVDEGHSAAEIGHLITEGLCTVDGVRHALAGAPVEWVKVFEEGSPRTSD